MWSPLFLYEGVLMEALKLQFYAVGDPSLDPFFLRARFLDTLQIKMMGAKGRGRRR